MTATPYTHAQAQGEEALRRALLDVASELLTAEGPHALTMRRIAEAAGCSTTVLYRLFGSKEGIADALFRRGFELFAAELDAAPRPPDPLDRLDALGAAYRASALRHPSYYRIMFGRVLPGYRPSQDSIGFALSTLRVLVDAVQEAIDAGVPASDDAPTIAQVLWASGHGLVSLELDGYLPSEVAEQRYATLVTALRRGFLAPG